MKNPKIRLIGLLVTLTTLLALILPAAPAMAVAGVDLVLLPQTQSIGVSNNFTVTVQAQAGTLTVSGIEIHLDYDTNYLSILSATSGTALPTVLQRTFKNPGTFDFAAGLDVSLDPLVPASGTFTLVSITFNATQPTPSPTQVIFHTPTGSSDTRITSVVSGETNITGTLTGGSYGISGPFFTTQPGGAKAGTALNPQPVVQMQDGFGNPVTADNSTMVTLTVTGNTTLLLGTTTVKVVNGVANFSGLNIKKAGIFTLTANTNTGLTATSAPFNITASNLGFTTQPSGGIAGSIWSQQPVVAIQDALGNTITSDNSTQVTLAISGNNSGLLVGTKTVTAVNGLATFSGLSVNQTGSYTLTTSSNPALATSTSNSFSITPGPANQITFKTQPGGAVAGNPLSPQPVVAILDSFGNQANDNSTQITLAISGNNSSILQGTKTVTASNGLATFSGINVTQIGNYTLSATSSPALGTATSNSFFIVGGPAVKLAFTSQPGGVAAGNLLNPQPVVTIEDAQGNPALNDSSTVITLTINGSNPAVLAGTKTATVVNGIATFNGLSVNQTGTYTLSATSNPVYTPATSTSFSIIAGPASKLAFVFQPGGAQAGAALNPQPLVAVQDAFGNLETSDNATSVSLTLSGNNPSLLSGNTTRTAVSGLVNFSGLSVNQTGTYFLTATQALGPNNNIGLLAAVSNNFTITPGPASTLVFTTQPGGAAAGSPLNPQPVVAIKDAFSNIVNTDSSTIITLAVTQNATLAGTTAVKVVNGVASFSGLNIKKAGTFTLSASNGAALMTAVSMPFSVTASQMAFTTQPGGGKAGLPWNQQPVIALQDALGSTVTSDNTTAITLTLSGNNPALLLGTASVTVVNGLASFSGLSVNQTGSYTLTATSNTSLPQSASASFTITPGNASQMVFTTQPVGATAGNPLTKQPVVAVEDAFANVVSTDNTTSITLALSGNATPVTLAGNKTLTAVNGLATFSGLSVNQTGTNYVLSATGTTSGNNTFRIVSNTFFINGPSSQMVFSTQPGGAGAGGLLKPQPAVQIQDAAGLAVQDDNSTSVTLAITQNTTAALSGTAKVKAASGNAIFSGLSINQTGTYNLTATSNTTLPPVTSFTFTIAPPVNLSLLPAAQTILLPNSFTVSVQAQSANSTRTDQIGVFLDYDANSLKIISANTTTAFNVGNNDFSSPGQYNFTGSGGEGAPTGNFVVVTLTFQALKVTGNSTAITFHVGGNRDTFTIFNSIESDTTGTLTPASVNIVGGEIIINSNIAGTPLAIAGATFTVSPNPYSGIPTSGTLTVADNGANDSNSAFGTIDLKNIPSGNYTIAQTAAPAGFNPDPASQTANVASSSAVTKNFANTSQSSGYSGGGGNAGIVPAVISVTPANVATAVAVNSPLTATFSVPMFSFDLNTATFTLMKGTTPVIGSVVYDSTSNRVTLTPGAPLSYGTVYTATISGSVRSAQGVALGISYVWTFTTAAAPPPATTTPVATTPVATTPAATTPVATTPAATVPVVTGPPTTTPGAPPTTTTRPATTTPGAPVPTTTPATTVATTTPASTGGTSIWWVAVIILIIIIIAVLLLIMLLTRRKKSDDKK